jgi:hypothetical protein
MTRIMAGYLLTILWGSLTSPEVCAEPRPLAPPLPEVIQATEALDLVDSGELAALDARIQAGLLAISHSRTLQQREAETLSVRQLARERQRLARARLADCKARFVAFPVFIPEEEVELLSRRSLAEQAYLQAQLDVAAGELLLARTYDRKTPEFREQVSRAIELYEELHIRHRSLLAGLFARLSQGRCYEELGEIRIALGIYEEILEHQGNSPSLIQLRDQALVSRLRCLNTDTRRDYALVEIEASEWLAAAGERGESALGNRIRWELCRALVALARRKETAADQRSARLQRAAETALQIQRIDPEMRPHTAKLLDIILQLQNDALEPAVEPDLPST